MSAQGLTYFAHAWANTNQKVGIAQADRRFHFLATGRTGTGRSSLLLNKLVQDVRAGRGVGLIDPHGDLADAVLPFIPERTAQAPGVPQSHRPGLSSGA